MREGGFSRSFATAPIPEMPKQTISTNTKEREKIVFDMLRRKIPELPHHCQGVFDDWLSHGVKRIVARS
jgi:hypothetical protein